METESQRERDVMSNHIPFLFLKSGNISRKFVTKKMRSCDKNFGQLQLKIPQMPALKTGVLEWITAAKFPISGTQKSAVIKKIIM